VIRLAGQVARSDGIMPALDAANKDARGSPENPERAALGGHPPWCSLAREIRERLDAVISTLRALRALAGVTGPTRQRP